MALAISSDKEHAIPSGDHAKSVDSMLSAPRDRRNPAGLRHPARRQHPPAAQIGEVYRSPFLDLGRRVAARPGHENSRNLVDLGSRLFLVLRSN
jgi:hypothetical protein